MDKPILIAENLMDVESTELYAIARKLTQGEIDLLRGFYPNDELPMDDLRIRSGSPILFKADAVTIDNLTSFRSEMYEDDFSKSIYQDSVALLCHEMCHVWQWHNSIKINVEHWPIHGPYHWYLAMWEQIYFGSHVYDYLLDENKKFTEYRYEQMGKMIQDYAFAKLTGTPWTDELAKLEKVIESVVGRLQEPLKV